MTDEKPIGHIDENTPVGSLIIMEGIETAPGDEYTLTGHFEGDGDIPPSFELAGVGEGDKDLEARHTYDNWNDDYASFAAEIKYPPTTGEGKPATFAGNAPTARLSFLEEAVASARDDFKEAEVEYLALKEQASAAKKKMDDDQDALNKAVDAWLEDREIGATGWPKNAPLAKEACQAPASAPTKMEWYEQDDGHFEARSKAWSSTEGGLLWRVTDSGGEWSLSQSEHELIGHLDIDRLGPFLSADEAMKAAQSVDDEQLHENVKAPAPADDAWRNVLLRDLTPEIKPGILKVLLEHQPPIVSMGDLADWQKEKGDYWAKDIKGIGKAACDSIAEATDAYWVANATNAG